ncbi:MAG TPA: molybdopterin-dependent oxidoreductase [Bryobacteraceae bacterium]|nr:molybdopterin-dependent oxidoreductase [Bryobacteraceae bacterium]
MRFFGSLRLQAAFLAALGIPFCAHPAQDQAEPPAITVRGDLAAKLVLSADDLAKMPHQKASVTEQDETPVEYEGVSLREILARAGAPVGKELRGKALASYILVKARDGYQVVFTLAELAPEFANETILVADKRDGKPLFGYQGPFRLVCPNDKAGARSVRMLQEIDFVRLQK